MAKKSHSSRRDFLRGKSALEALSELPNTLDPVDSTPVPPPDAIRDRDEASYLIQISRDAMACEFEVLLNAGQHSGATEAALESLDLIEQLEDQLSIYRGHSELSRINEAASDRDVVVESRLFQLLQLSLQLNEQTGGAFEITAGPLGKTWGFHRRAGRFPETDEIEAALQQVGSRLVQLDPQTQTIRFLKPGVEINVNAIGKGYALDRAAEVLRDEGVDDFLIHGGQSSLLAKGGRRGVASGRSGWSVGVQHPLRHDTRLAEVWLRDQALGTSGSGNQFFHFDGQRYGHVIDPRTGYPAAELLSATIIAPSAAIADALATAAFVMGRESTLEICEARDDLGAILVAPGSRAGDIEVDSSGLSDDAWNRLD
jgi:thiamine biosynthesis lipoprotein